MSVIKIGELIERGMIEAADELRRCVAAGEAISMAIIVEVRGQRTPMALIRGGFRRDGFSMLAALARVQHLVHLDLDAKDFCETR